MRNASTVAPLALLGACLILAGCTTTRPSATVAGNGSFPAPISNFQIVSPGEVYRSGQPKKGDWFYLKAIGVKTVVKLNKISADEDETEELSLAEQHHIKVIQIYMQPEDGRLNLWAHPTEESLTRAVAALEDKNNWPVLVHCSHGKDRTGLVVALYNMRNNNFCKKTANKQRKYYGASPFLFGIQSMFKNIENIEKRDCVSVFAP